MAIQEAWSLGYTGLGINVAIVDIGVDVDHPDLKRNIVSCFSRKMPEVYKNNSIDVKYVRKLHAVIKLYQNKLTIDEIDQRQILKTVIRFWLQKQHK
jgi:hypothetical protein